uniref:Ribosome maturation factor RimM n=1 Tax=uncultured bacterium contig00056 TaxID=1181540 RepID=A0A806KCA8_9BACT|nr:16S rRNA processing protein RimM [uncultured bacterium contig00056]
MTNKFIIGQIGSPFGVKGFVKVRSLSGETAHLLKLESVTVSKDGKEQTLRIEESAPAAEGVLMRFEGIDTPEKAKTLTGAQMIAGRDQAAVLEDGEHYIEDLKGLHVITSGGENVGTVLDVIEGGGGELAEIELSNGEKRLVPFRKEFFSEISPAQGRVVLQNLWILE